MKFKKSVGRITDTTGSEASRCLTLLIFRYQVDSVYNEKNHNKKVCTSVNTH